MLDACIHMHLVRLERSDHLFRPGPAGYRHAHSPAELEIAPVQLHHPFLAALQDPALALQDPVPVDGFARPLTLDSLGERVQRVDLVTDLLMRHGQQRPAEFGRGRATRPRLDQVTGYAAFTLRQELACRPP